MKAMVLNQIWDLEKTDTPLQLVDFPMPGVGRNDLLIKVSACGVCHTELDEIEGRTPPPAFPMIPGHQVVGVVAEKGSNVTRFHTGDRVGVAWINSSCLDCRYCRNGQENLCPDFKATGRDAHGGYAQYTCVHQNFAFPIPSIFTDEQAAPLLCAGAIGYRSLKLTGLKNGQKLGLTGFGASAHLVLKLSRHQYPDSDVYVFARSERERIFAQELGAVWAGDTTDQAPEKLNAVIDTTPAWKPVVQALKNLDAGGRLVINAIRKEDRDQSELLKLDYPLHLWMEKEIKSVANVAVRDVRDFLTLAAQIPILPEYQEYRLDQANQALMELKQRKIRGAKVLKIDG